MAASDKTLSVTCPCCGTHLRIDAHTGAILSEDRPRKGPVRSFEDAARETAARQKQAKEQLARAMAEEKNKDEIMEKKFKEAVKRAEEDDAPPPPRPFDLD